MTGEQTLISTGTSRKFNATYSSAEYAGYMYTIGTQRGTGTSSTVKGIIDAWYKSYLSSYSAYISDNTSFCYNRGAYSNSSGTTTSTGTGTSTQYFESYINLRTNKTPSLVCDYNDDDYTVSSADNGNNALTYPIGLISADEASLAGLLYSTSNTSNYLYVNNVYWLGSPAYSTSSAAYIFYVKATGSLDYVSAGDFAGTRVVVSLNKDVNITGSGSYSDPYVVAS